MKTAENLKRRTAEGMALESEVNPSIKEGK